MSELGTAKGRQTESVRLFTAGRQLWKVRGMMWFLLLVGLAFMAWGVDLVQTYGLSPGDGGVLRPLAERLAWGLSLAAMGLACIVGMDLYGRLYLAQINYAPAAGTLELVTLRYWGSAARTVSTAEIVRSKFNDGQFYTESHTVNAPWFNLHIKGSRLPLLIDGQGSFSDLQLAKRLLKL